MAMAVLPPDPGSYGLSFACKGLRNLDTFSKSDPIVVIRQKMRGVMVEIGRTETIEDDLNPIFKRKIYVDWNPPGVVELQFAVYDVDEEADALKNKDLIGMMDIKLGDIILADGMTVSKALKGLKGDENESKYGLIIISASEAEAPLDFKDGCTAELFIECHGLKNMDLLSQSDPMCVVGMRAHWGGMFQEVGRTEAVTDNLNPKFTQTISVDYTEAKPIELQFTIYDIDNTKSDVKDQDFLGVMEVMLLELTSSRASTVSKALKSKDGVASEKKRGIITVRAEPRGIADNTPKAILTVECQGLATKDVFEKPQPMCIVSQKARNNHWKEMGRTERLDDTLDPKFAEKVTLLYFANEVQDLKLSVFTAEHYIGCFELKLNDLVKARRSKLIDYLKGADGKTSSSHGMITVSAEIVYPGRDKNPLEEEEEEEEEAPVDESTLSDAERIARMKRKLGRVKGKTHKFEDEASNLSKLLARGNNCTFKREGTVTLRKAIQE